MPVRCCLGLLVLALIPWFGGCEEEEVAWMPDSSGLMFRDETKGWSRYDLRKNATEQLVKATTNGKQGIAISPRGDQFAVGTVTGKDNQLGLQMTVYSGSGDILQKSIRFHIGQYGDSVPEELWLEWSASGRIAVFAETGTGIYDPRTAKLAWLADYAPYMEASYEGSNLLPDGSGLILSKMDPEAAAEKDPAALPPVIFADWEGRILRTTRLPPTPPDLRKVLNDRERKSSCLVDYAVWNNPTCQLQINDFRLDFNPRTGSAAWRYNPLSLPRRIPGFDAGASYTLLPVGHGGTFVYYREKEKDATIEMMNVRTKAHRVLAKDLEVDGAVLSPDRKKIAISFAEQKPGSEMLQGITMIVDENGKVLARLPRGEHQPPPAAPSPPALAAPVAAGEGEAPVAPSEVAAP